MQVTTPAAFLNQLDSVLQQRSSLENGDNLTMCAFLLCSSRCAYANVYTGLCHTRRLLRKHQHVSTLYLVSFSKTPSKILIPSSFFKKPDYDIAVAKYADANKQPIAINELISLGILHTNATDFTGAAMVIAGQYDFIYCTSACDDILEPAAETVFKKARAFKAVSYPLSGHGLNFALNALGAFELITNFLEESGL